MSSSPALWAAASYFTITFSRVVQKFSKYDLLGYKFSSKIAKRRKMTMNVDYEKEELFVFEQFQKILSNLPITYFKPDKISYMKT